MQTEKFIPEIIIKRLLITLLQILVNGLIRLLEPFRNIQNYDIIRNNS